MLGGGDLCEPTQYCHCGWCDEAAGRCGFVVVVACPCLVLMSRPRIPRQADGAGHRPLAGRLGEQVGRRSWADRSPWASSSPPGPSTRPSSAAPCPPTSRTPTGSSTAPTDRWRGVRPSPGSPTPCRASRSHTIATARRAPQLDPCPRRPAGSQARTGPPPRYGSAPGREARRGPDGPDPRWGRGRQPKAPATSVPADQRFPVVVGAVKGRLQVRDLHGLGDGGVQVALEERDGATLAAGEESEALAVR